MAASLRFCDQCGAPLGVGVRFCEACGAPLAGAPGAMPAAITPPGANRAAAHVLVWAAPVVLAIAAIAGWLWLRSPEPLAPPARSVQPPTTTAVGVPPALEPTPASTESPDRLAAESVDTPPAAGDAVATEYRAVKARFDRAYSAYTMLITEGGSGDVIEARDEYAAAHEDLKRFEAAHPEYVR